MHYQSEIDLKKMDEALLASIDTSDNTDKLLFNPDGKSIVFVSSKNTLNIVELGSWDIKSQLVLPKKYGDLRILGGFLHESKAIAAATSTGHIYVWFLNPEHQASCYAIRAFKPGRLIEALVVSASGCRVAVTCSYRVDQGPSRSDSTDYKVKSWKVNAPKNWVEKSSIKQTGILETCKITAYGFTLDDQKVLIVSNRGRRVGAEFKFSNPNKLSSSADIDIPPYVRYGSDYDFNVFYLQGNQYCVLTNRSNLKAFRINLDDLKIDEIPVPHQKYSRFRGGCTTVDGSLSCIRVATYMDNKMRLDFFDHEEGKYYLGGVLLPEGSEYDNLYFSPDKKYFILIDCNSKLLRVWDNQKLISEYRKATVMSADALSESGAASQAEVIPEITFKKSIVKYSSSAIWDEINLTENAASQDIKLSKLQMMLNSQAGNYTVKGEAEEVVKEKSEQSALRIERIRSEMASIAVRLVSIEKQSSAEETLFSEVESLKARQAILFEEREQRVQSKAQQDSIYSKPKLAMFYSIFQTKLNAWFVAYLSLESGLVQSKPSGAVGVASQGITLLGEFISLPVISGLAHGVAMLINYFKRKKIKVQGSKSVSLAHSITQMDAITEAVARSLCFKYQDNILQLTEDGASMLGEWCVKPVIAWAYQQSEYSSTNQDALIESLISIVSQGGYDASTNWVKELFGIKATLSKDVKLPLAVGGSHSAKELLKSGIRLHAGLGASSFFKEQLIKNEEDLKKVQSVADRLEATQAVALSGSSQLRSALFSYQKQGEGELTVDTDEEVIVLGDAQREGWSRVKNQFGGRGIVPTKNFK